jgi:NAD(P)-dependent dehydrogenase (short-subunit alcohol dehydrogenase family)
VDELRFDGRVAVVTGAGRGIGRAYAQLLASRGCSVVVNDLGGSMGGEGSDNGPALGVAREISVAGGTAIADCSDVATVDGAEELVAQAVLEFGRIDIVINNAGIMRWGALPELDAAAMEAHWLVHVMGSFNTIHAAWPHFLEQEYGRIVNTTSAGIFGLPNNTAYATAKAGIVGMTRSISLTGAKHGIKANCIAPAAMTRMAGVEEDAPPGDPMAPELVAPMAAYLAHEQCPVSGEIYTAGAGRFARLFIGTTEGWVADADAMVESVASSWGQVTDEAGYAVPADLMSWSDGFTTHRH